MRGVCRFVLGLAAFALGGTAVAQEAAEGVYVTEQMETASMLDLAPEGRFRWILTYGALDMSAEGRWRREGDAVLLDTEPPVTPPRFEYLGAGGEEAPALIVRIEDERGRTPGYLDVQADYDSGEPGHAYLSDDAYRFEPEPGRRIVAIRVGSGAFRFWSEPYPVPTGASQMRFRFFPGDLGRGDFRGTRATLEGEALLLPVLGEPLRYRRLNAEEQAEYRGMIEDIAAEAGAAPTPEASGFMPVGIHGPLELAIGAPVDPRLLPSEHGDGLFAAGGSIELSVRIGERRVDFGRISGGEADLLLVQAPRSGQGVERIHFLYQDRLLTIDEALERARALRGRLGEAGLVEHSPRPGRLEWPSFFVIAHARDGEAAFLSGQTGIRGSDWESAGRLLSDPAVGAVTMHLFTLEAAGVHAMALLENASRLAERSGSGVDAAGDGDGREWMLSVTIMRDRPEEEDLQAIADAASSTDMGDDPEAGAAPMDLGAGATTLIDAENQAYWRQCGDPELRISAAEGIAGCTRLIEGGWLDSENLEIAHTNRGHLRSDEGDNAGAIADYDIAIGLNPRFGMAYWGRAGVHESLGDFPAALADAREAARLEPEHPDTLNSLCWYLGIAGEELDRAREACDASLRLRPDDADTLDSRGLVGLKQQRFQEAWADYDAAARIEPDRASFVYGRSIAALRLGRAAEGRADLERAATLDTGIAETYARHGVRP